MSANAIDEMATLRDPLPNRMLSMPRDLKLPAVAERMDIFGIPPSGNRRRVRVTHFEAGDAKQIPA
jgi:hypothetical protein